MTWKATERAVAARLGGERVSKYGLGGEQADVETEWLSVEVKHRKKLPKWLLGAMAQARDNAAPGKLPAVVLHEHGHRHDDNLVVLRQREFVAWFGDWEGRKVDDPWWDDHA